MLSSILLVLIRLNMKYNINLSSGNDSGCYCNDVLEGSDLVKENPNTGAGGVSATDVTAPPATGDKTPNLLLAALPAAALGTAVLYRRHRRKGQEDEPEKTHA